MEIKENLTNANYNKMDNKENKFIVIHYVGAVSTAYNNSVYFKNVNRSASANYFVDENEIYRVVKDTDKAWHCGDKLKSGNGGSYYGKCTNSNSIGIEMCCYDNNGTLDIKEEVVNKTIELVKELMAKYNIPAENVIRHYDVTNKICPAPFVNDESRWADFKNKLGGEYKQPTSQPVKENQNTGNVATIQSTLNNRYGYSIAVDNIYGNETHKALVRALQHELNVQYRRGLAEDGIFGNLTYNACPNVKKTASGNITWLIQAMLSIKGYNTNGVDGLFGSGTDNAVRQFQRDNGLSVDGVVGKNTFRTLFK